MRTNALVFNKKSGTEIIEPVRSAKLVRAHLLLTDVICWPNCLFVLWTHTQINYQQQTYVVHTSTQCNPVDTYTRSCCHCCSNCMSLRSSMGYCCMDWLKFEIPMKLWDEINVLCNCQLASRRDCEYMRFQLLAASTTCAKSDSFLRMRVDVSPYHKQSVTS
jgi:hypothetical protein